MQTAASVAPDNKWILSSVPSGVRFVPWGNNYAAEGIEESDKRSWDKIDQRLFGYEEHGALTSCASIFSFPNSWMARTSLIHRR